jgi:CDP-glycerol glycerophosphotransferase (TagB/SpsB family)
MQKILTGAILLLSYAVYPFSFLFPRDKRVWAFVGWHKNKEREIFSDNSKYLFLHVANTRKDIRAIWIADDDKLARILRKRGYESYSITSLKGIYYSLRAGWTIIDAVIQLHNWRYSGGSSMIQLWHADGLKNLELDGRGFRFFIASSPYIAKHFMAPSFGAPLERVRITGLPRYDIFFKNISGAEIDQHTELEEKLDAVKTKDPKKVIFYAPTFRRGKSPKAQLDHLQLEKLNDFLLKQNYFLFISLHPKFASSDWASSDRSNIFFINPDFDKYPLLPRFDMVITDYSSTCLEFLLLDKPAIFYVYDFEEYKKDPGIPEEFWGLVPGPRVKTFEELLAALQAPDTLGAERKRVRDILFTFERGHCAEAVTREILKEIGGSPR